MSEPIDDAGIRDVRIQIVLFENDVESQRRLATAVGATVRHARDDVGLGRCTVRLGDSSPERCLSESDVESVVTAIGGGVDDVSYRHFGANLGSAGGSNALAAGDDASTEHERVDDAIWVLNPDTCPGPTTLTALVTALRQPGVGAAEGRQIPIEHPKAFDPATGDTSWGSGCCLLLRRSVFDEVGGFDDRFFPMYCDDVDICWRIRLAGHRVVHVPTAPVFHDKQIVNDGTLPISDFEEFSGALARLFLHHRYGRPDLADEFRSWVASHGAPPHRRALAEFDERAARGDVPEPIADADRVASFVDGHFGSHRFNYNG